MHSRLLHELHRLYHLTPESPTAPDGRALLGPEGHTRALVLEVCGPASWEPLAQVWAGVQQQLDWPAPAIAASGQDGLQLWFSLAEPVSLARAQEVLQALRAHHLAELAPKRVRLWPSADGAVPTHAAQVPAQVGEEAWSAYVSPDLAPLFAQTPWLDLPPNEDGQAQLLHGLASLSPQTLAEGVAQLQALTRAAPTPAPVTAGEPAAQATNVAAPSMGAPAAPALPVTDDPRAFLQAVMNHAEVPLALRIEAAKALLPGA